MTPTASISHPRWREWRARLAWLRPMDNGPHEIRAMDGLRAIAALSVVAFHTLLAVQFGNVPVGQAFNRVWYFLASGVQLFFVLSGFLLFLPYVRPLLNARPLPSAARFYRRRALRIFPAYWVCLAVLATVEIDGHWSVAWLPNLAAHVGMIHNMFPEYNQAIEGPFWTLAVEWQFYMLLPLMATGIARLVGASRSVVRLVSGVLCVMALGVALRGTEAVLMVGLPALPASVRTPVQIGVQVTLGMQGKWLEVFAVGMLCAVLYVVTVEQRRISPHALQRLAYAGLVVTVLDFIYIMPRWPDSAVRFAPGTIWNAEVLLYPLLVGIGYGALALAVLWGNHGIRFIFELAPLRVIGLISYSLYLWHLPFVDALLPGVAAWPMALCVVAAFVTAYLSYQLIERPFLKWRHREKPAPKPLPMPGEGAIAVASDMC